MPSLPLADVRRLAYQAGLEEVQFNDTSRVIAFLSDDNVRFNVYIIPRELSGRIYYILGRERHSFSVVMLGECAIGHEDFLNITLTHMRESYLVVWRY